MGIRKHCTGLTDQGLWSLSAQQPPLVHLDVSNCSQLTDEGLRAVVTLPQLCYLEVAYCGQISDVGVWILSTLP
jgi:hypothetical protein